MRKEEAIKILKDIGEDLPLVLRVLRRYYYSNDIETDSDYEDYEASRIIFEENQIVLVGE